MPVTEVISASDHKSAEKAALILKKGGVIVYPTETLYGIGALASNNDAVERIFEIKGRPHGKPIPLLIKNLEMLSKIAEGSQLASAMAQEYWPGALTIILKQKAMLPGLITCGTGKIALRISAHPFLQSLFDLIEEPLTSTSANISGDSNISDSEELFETFNGKVDLIVDSGKIPESRGSTIVDLTLDPPQVLREGDINSAILKEFIDGHS
ncbi:MAG: L-threonylcarbamoyladenylate synthase [Thermodesulfobacteriota bacterium]